ncbi:MAG: hypothetical protein ABIN83_03295 [Sphingomicrobium sp.]
MPKDPMRGSTLLFTLWALTGCAGGQPIAAASGAACAALIPAEWRDGVLPAPLPEGQTVGDWIAFADAQTGKLDEANGRTRDAIGIVERCEGRHSQAIKRARRGWLRRLTG